MRVPCMESRETLQTLNVAAFNTPSLARGVGTSNKQVCVHPTDSPSPCTWNPLLWRFQPCQPPSRCALPPLAPRCISFVHSVSSPNPPPPHHESTASTWRACHQQCRDDLESSMLSLLLGLDTVGSQRGPTEVLYAMWRGERCSAADASSR